jgi:hypothetical protein
MRNIILAITVFTLVSPARAVTQEFLWLKPGAKVRVTAPTLGLSELIGRLQVLNGDTLVVQVEARRQGRLQVEVLQVPMPAIAKLDVTTGRRGHWLEGAGIGFVAGALIGLASGDDRPNQWFGYSAGEKALGGGLGFGLIGAGVGALVKSDKWAEVPLDQVRPRLIAGPGRQVGVGVALRF